MIFFWDMKKIFIIVVALFTLAACKRHRKKPSTPTKILNFGSFNIETPLLWGRVKEDSSNDNTGRIAIDDKDTIYFNYSEGLGGSTDASKIISENGVNGKVNRKQKEIDGYRAWIISPQQPGTGITGVYIDSIEVTGSNIERFYLYGNNLSSKNEKDVLKAIKTLKFTKK